MLKRDELFKPTSCLNRAAADEPVFVLRAKDPMAAMAVRHWVTMREGKHEQNKLIEALNLADQMDEWRAKNVPTALAK